VVISDHCLDVMIKIFVFCIFFAIVINEKLELLSHLEALRRLIRFEEESFVEVLELLIFVSNILGYKTVDVKSEPFNSLIVTNSLFANMYMFLIILE